LSATPITDPHAETGPAPRPPGLFPFDFVLALAGIGIMICSLVTLHAATSGGRGYRPDVAGNPNYYVTRQGVYFFVGAILAVGLSRLDYSRLRELKYGLYALLMASILLVLAVGSVAKGAQRSIQLPFFSFQASELGKVLIVLVLAAFVTDRSRGLGSRDTTARVMLLALIPAAFVMMQPDLGSSLVYLVIVLTVLFVAGTAWQHFAALAALGAVAIALVLVAAPAAGVQVVKPYQKDRLTAFLNPTDNPAKQGYQQNQSRIAIGSGEKTGRGDNATQTKLNFLPEHHTDFVFAVVGEQWGFVGAALVLSLYALLIWRGLRILTMSKNLYGALVAGGIVAMLMFQVFVNVGMTIGIMPITGIPLPLMSYGGSSVITTLLALGLLQSIYAQGRQAAAYKGRILSF
jgi:rod shape determining protein RodA